VTAVRRLIVSDLHFGSGDDLLAAPAALERIEPELAWADELVINGDLFELVFAPLEEAVEAARPFLALADRHVRRVHYIPGNHDHHLVALARDEVRLYGAQDCAGTGAGEVCSAARLLRALCQTAEIRTAYPVCELDGMLFMHGHYVDPHIRSSDRRLMDGLARQLSGAGRPRRLTAEDYEALLTPLYELMYEIVNLPHGRRARKRFERWRHFAATFGHTPTARVLQAMQTVCDDLDLQTRTVVFGHTHMALDGVCTPDGRHRLFNSGSWVWDGRGRARIDASALWPRRVGTVLRATGAELELRGLLDDCGEAELAEMTAVPQQLAAA
jgi:hypothetical protein